MCWTHSLLLKLESFSVNISKKDSCIDYMSDCGPGEPCVSVTAVLPHQTSDFLVANNGQQMAEMPVLRSYR